MGDAPVKRGHGLTEELQGRLIAALQTGLKPRWVALLCGVAPKSLYSALDAGAKLDAREPYKSFVIRWTRAEAELMQEHVRKWRDEGSSAAHQFLAARWPNVWGKEAEPDYETLSETSSNAEELGQLESIIEDPEAFGVEDMFARHGWVRHGPKGLPP